MEPLSPPGRTGPGGGGRMPAVNGVGEPCAGEPHARFEVAGAGNGADLTKGTGVAQPPGKPAEHEGPRPYRQRATAPAPDPTHAHLREDERRAFLGAAYHGLEADAGQACKGPGPAAAAPASACPGAGAVAGQRGARALRLLRRARQPQGGGGVPHPGDAALAGGAAAPQPALPPGLEAHEPPGDPVAAACPRG